LHARDYDEMEHNDANKTWEYLEQKRRSSFELARQRDNHL
jgi:hypothetical protein